MKVRELWTELSELGEHEGKKGASGHWSFANRDNRDGWWLFADILRAVNVGGKERLRPAQLSGVDWPV